MPDWRRCNPLTLTLSQRERGSSPRSSLLPSPLAGEGLGMRGFVNGFGSWHGWRRVGREGRALDRVSPALRAGASNFSLRGQRKVIKRKATPANPLASPVTSVQSQRRTGRRRRHIPVPTAATPSSLMASLTLPLTLGGLEGDHQYRVHLIWASLSSGIDRYFYTKGLSAKNFMEPCVMLWIVSTPMKINFKKFTKIRECRIYIFRLH